MPKKESLTPEQVAETLRQTNGLIYLAAEKLGVSARTVYRYGRRHRVVKVALKHAKGKRLDTAEAALWKAILSGEAWAICFYLKTQGKKRGYVERQQIDAGGKLADLCKVLLTSEADTPPGEEPFNPAGDGT